jgi:hypothetical protein
VNVGNQGDTRRAEHYAKTIGALLTARALVGHEIDPDAVQRLRSQAAARVRERAIAIGKARRANGQDAAQRHGLALKQRLDLSRERLRTGRVATGEVAQHVRTALVRQSKQAPGPAEIMRFHIETAGPTEPSVLRETVREVLGFASVAEMTKAGATIETPLGNDASSQVFAVLLAVRSAALALPASQITAMLRAGTGARVAAVPSPRLAKLRRLVEAHEVANKKHGIAAPKEEGCMCCRCRCEAPAGERESQAARPTWPGIPDDTEWHLKQMRVKEAWALKPPAGGKSRGQDILIGHPDTGWREHVEYDRSQLRFDLARNVIEGKDGKTATRHGTLTIPPALFQTHGTATGGVIVSAEANGHTHVSDVPFDKSIATSSNVQLTGVAPKVELAPIRCADGVVLLMDPNIHKAVQHAIDIGAHVISISLGGILDAECERIIDRAVFDHHIIVVGAAGQIVDWGDNSVIEPANFTNVVAVAGSTPAATPWDGSCRGPKVAVSAPARGVWFPNFFLEGTPGIYWGEGTSFSAAQVAAVAALWLAHWGRPALIARYGDVPLAHVFRQLLRKTAWRPKTWNNLYGTGIVDAYALLREPLPPKAEIIAPSDTDAFNLFEAVSDFVDMGGAIAGSIWSGLVEAGGAVGDFASEMLALSGLNEGLAIVGSIAERATGATKAWADEQAAQLGGLVDDSLNAASDAWDAVVEGGEEAAGAVGDIVEEAGSQLADVGDAANDAWDQAVDFVTSLW